MDHTTRKQFRSWERVAVAGLALALIYCGDPSSQTPSANDVPPNAVFTPSCTELTCSFTDASTDPDGTIVSRIWNYGDGSALSDIASHTYASEGSYSITLTVTDDGGAHAAASHEVTVSTTTPPLVNTPPNAGFTSSCSELACSFTDASSDADGTVTSRSWSFGDGSVSTAVNPVHTYAQAAPTR